MNINKYTYNQKYACLTLLCMQESRINRSIIKDTRVHCCFYFIDPTGHGYVMRAR